MIKPISPNEVQLVIPDFIIATVNKLIKEKWDGEEAIIQQDEILALVASNDPDDNKPSRQTVFDRGWLNFEPMYREIGWHVEYDKPGYNESYKAFFRFTK